VTQFGRSFFQIGPGRTSGSAIAAMASSQPLVGMNGGGFRQSIETIRAAARLPAEAARAGGVQQCGKLLARIGEADAAAKATSFSFPRA
jgi:hypothetical protein